MSWEPFNIDPEVRSLVNEDASAVDFDGDTFIDGIVDDGDDANAHTVNVDGSPTERSFDLAFGAMSGMFSEAATVADMRERAYNVGLMSTHIFDDITRAYPKIVGESVQRHHFTDRLSPVGVREFRVAMEDGFADKQAELLLSVRDFVKDHLPRFRAMTTKLSDAVFGEPFSSAPEGMAERVIADRDFYIVADNAPDGEAASVLEMTYGLYHDFIQACSDKQFPAKPSFERLLDTMQGGNRFVKAVAGGEVVGKGYSRGVMPQTVGTLVSAMVSGLYLDVLDAAVNYTKAAGPVMDDLERLSSGSEGTSFDAAFIEMFEKRKGEYIAMMTACDILEASFDVHEALVDFLKAYRNAK